jgi:hypothetical protein
MERPMNMTDEQLGKELSLIVKEALEQRLVPLSIRMNSLSLELAKMGELKQLEARIEARLITLEKLEARIQRLETLGTELEIHLAESAGFNAGRGSAAVQ